MSPCFDLLDSIIIWETVSGNPKGRRELTVYPLKQEVERLAYHIGKYEFETEKDYEAGKRDAKKILLFRSIKGSEIERCQIFLNAVKRQRIQFETYLGEDFIKKLRLCIEKEKKNNLPEEKTLHVGPFTRAVRFIKRHRKPLKYVKYTIMLLITVTLSSQFLSIPVNAIKSYLSLNEMRQTKKLVDNEALKNVRMLPYKTTASKKEVLPAKETPKSVLPEYKTLKEQNKDLVGWLSIANTSMDYPVMYKKGDSEFYLSHNFEKQEDANGLLTLDKRCDLENKGGQYIIYGHNMRLGNMFGELLNYKKESFYKSHKTIGFDTMFEKNTYEIVAVFLSKRFYECDNTFKFYNYIQFSSEKEFKYFYDNIKKMSIYPIKAEVSYGDTFLSLVTCEYSQENGRFVVIAKKAEKEK